MPGYKTTGDIAKEAGTYRMNVIRLADALGIAPKLTGPTGIRIFTPAQADRIIAEVKGREMKRKARKIRCSE